ncbi:hypothetical protein [Bythopirellula polymerisocia]|uniref:Uncharacterized protein n=1 Tax=Bythopirellula polymerisocia TaxID=2528003 RepID=A0A5C6D162_9BACT|nr:hypothetical protein [Bythopirellula polymerisocia]TWU29925.1 hypothetical protein Pla144_07060 [Bythopirellula polymerisocia]
MITDDPTPTYRGYRRQALYALFRLFDDGLPEGSVIQPEGNEDLAVFDAAGSLVEIVQVKDHSDNLAASSFKPSFYERIAPHCAAGSSTIVRIASFGPIGPDLQNAVSGDATAQARVLKTLTKTRTREQKLADGKTKTHTIPGLPQADAKNIIDHVELTPVAEDVLTGAVVSALTKTITGVDAQHAFDFLMWWLLTSSESQLRIDRSRAIAKVGRIGKFLSQRAAYHDEWYTSIVPIGPSDNAGGDKRVLAEEYYRGGRVRFDHIHSDLDVPRDRFLREIHTAFTRQNVVVVHSASGQGKTTLAYRYVKEFAPSDFRLEVLTSSNLKHARRLALALIGHAETVEVPTLVYLDVRPGDSYWSEVVRELASVVGIRVLVTIREEDWTRARISPADFSFAEVPLSFEKEEAEPIYRRLEALADPSRHLDFDDAWNQFGVRKTLFEFAYYITQEESLADRISSQIEALQDAVIRGERGESELELLRLVAVASAYEARLDLAKLLDCCELVAPQRTIERFNDEYLIRVSEEGSHVEGFHSIRSEIIANKLTDPAACPWAEAASRALPLIVEDDLESFLLCAFSRNPDSSKVLTAALDEFRPKTWIGVHGVAASLMWNGIKEYSEQNIELLDEVVQKVSSGWYAILDWDLGQVLGKEGFRLFESLEHISDEAAKAADYARSVKVRQSDKGNVFLGLRNWLSSFTKPPSPPEDMQNLIAMGELVFWLGHLQIESSLCEAITGDVIDTALNELHVYLLGEFIRGIRTCDPETYCEWLKSHREDLVTHLRSEAAIAELDETDDAVVAHYAIDIDRQSTVLRTRGNRSRASEATIHDLTIERVELLSNLFAGKKRYGAVGYGHRMSLVTQSSDEAEKPGVLAKNLHATWPPRFNALARGHVERRFRPNSWADYFQSLQKMRESVLAAIVDLRQAIPSLAKPPPAGGGVALQNPTKWDKCRKELNGQFLLPKVAVDEWGFVTETSSGDATDSRSERYSGSQRFSPVRKAVSEYTRTVGNFMSQVLDCMVLVPYLRNAESQSAKNNLLAKASTLGINEHSIRLSVINGVDACAAVDQLQRATRTVFGDAKLPGADSVFCERERRAIMTTITAWCIFIDGIPAENGGKSNKRSRPRKIKPRKPTGVGDLLVQTRNRLKNSLQALRKEGIEARILSETVPWNGMPTLWISYNTNHPLATLNAVERMWHQLVGAFRPDREKIVRVKAFDLLWSAIILVPLVGGKSLERQVLPHFKAVTYSEPPDLQESPWRLQPENTPEDVWPRLGLEHWDAQPSWAQFDHFAAAYGLLFHHVDHMADFNRLPDDLDELGLSILQSFLDHETTRAQPVLQEVFDTCAEVLNAFPEIDDVVIEVRPNIHLCMQLIVDMKDAIMPTADFHEQAKLSIEEVVDWRDRLFAGMQQFGVARYLWISDSLGFGAWNG